MNLPVTPKNIFIFILAASIASTIGGLPFNSLPVMLGSLADSFNLDSRSLGNIGSICFAGYLLGTLGAPFWINRLNWRTLTITSTLGTAGAFAVSSQLTSIEALYLVWAFIGFFASTMTCLGMRILADLPDKVRAFGARQGVELSITAAVLFALPPLIIAQWHYPGAALALAFVVGILGLSAVWVPQGPLLAIVEENEAMTGHSRLALPHRSWVCMSVFFVFLVGNIALWAFLERIGANLELTGSEVGIVFAILKLLGGAAAFFVAWIGDRAGVRWAYWIVLLGVLVGLLFLLGADSFLPFALGAWIWEFAFTCGCVLQVAGIARSDASGRAVVLVPAVFALSSMVGPGLAGQLAAAGSFNGVLLLAAVCSVLPALVYSFWQPIEN